MTDKQTLLDMFERAGIRAERLESSPVLKQPPPGVQGREGKEASSLEVESGYSGFRTYLTFDIEGNLLTMGAYE